MSAATMEELYNSAAEGSMEALLEYAGRLMVGDGCERRPDDAVLCYAQAVESGSREAAAELARRYAYGNGIDQDDELATEYYRKGAQLGDPEAMYKLFQRLSIGDGCSVNIDEADYWLKQSCDQGYERAQKAWDSLSASGKLGRTMDETRQAEEKKAQNLRSDRESTLSIEKVSPDARFKLGSIGKKNADDEDIISEDCLEEDSKKKVPGLMIVIYGLAGAISGILLKSVFDKQKDVFNSMTLFNYFDSSDTIMIYLIILGIVLGGAMGFLISKLYVKSKAGLLFYLPTVLLPMIILMAAVPVIPLLQGLGALLYGLLMIALGALGVYCLTASSNG